MNAELQKKCELLAANKEVLEKNFKLESTYIHAMCSYIFTAKGKNVDVTKLKECVGIIKENTGVLSNFRGHVKMALASMMAVEAEPEAFLHRVMEVYHLLKTNHTFSSEYFVIAAAAICNLDGYERKEELVAKTESLYKNMKQEHPFLTSSEDSAYAALLATSDLDTDTLVAEMERCYRLLEGEFFLKNAVQSLSHVLALNTEDSAAKCDKVKAIFEGLKEKNKKYGTGMELSILGAVSLMEEDAKTVVDFIAEADDLLKTLKGFSGIWGLQKHQRLMYAALLALNSNLPEMENVHTAAMSSTVSIIIAQQAAVCIAITAAGVAATQVS